MHTIFPTTQYLSYECGFVCQTTFELTPKQYLELILMLIPHLQSPLITKIQVESLTINNHKLSIIFDTQKSLTIDMSSYTKKDTTWGGGAFNNCLNEAAIHTTCQSLGWIKKTPQITFPLISDSSLFKIIQDSYKSLYPNLHFQHINGKPRHAIILSCPGIKEYPNPVHDALPTSINIHDRVPKLDAAFSYCPIQANGFYPINNHKPEETFECIEKLDKSSQIEFRIGSSQIHQLCKKELPNFKLKFPNLVPADVPCKREEFPILWLLKKAHRICLNLSEAQQIIEHEFPHKFLPKILEKQTLITRFIEDFGIHNAVISDSNHPLNIGTRDPNQFNVTIQKYELRQQTIDTIKTIFIDNSLTITQNETGCGDALVIGLQIANQLNKTETECAKFGLTIATTKYFWKESNLGQFPQSVLKKILQNI